MSDIGNQVLEAVNIIVDKKVSDLKFDRTVEAIIREVKDTSTGEYLVEYNGNIFSVFSLNLKKLYRVGDRVFIKIPEGDLSKKKFIEDSSGGSSGSGGEDIGDSDIIELQNNFLEVEPPITDLYGIDINSKGPYQLISGDNTHQDIVSCLEVTEGSNPSADSVLQKYFSNYNHLKISADFQTLFKENYVSGNYGVVIDFITSEKKTLSFVLDVNSFNGNYYHFSEYASQEAIYSLSDIKKEDIVGIKRVYCFEKFDTYDGQNSNQPNIFIRNIKIQFVEKVDLTQNQYYLQIQTPKGMIFKEDAPADTSLVLSARLLYQNEEVSTKENSVFTWFKRDASVSIGDEDYNKNAGPGWREIKETDPEVVDSNTLTIKSQNVIYENKYKVIVVYNKKIVRSQEASVLKENSDYQIIIKSIVEETGTKLKIINNKENSQTKYVGDWSVFLPDGRYEVLGQKVNEIKIEDYLYFERLIFYCDVFQILTETPELTYSQLISTERYVYGKGDFDSSGEGGGSSNPSLQLFFEGPSVFKYDANGDIDVKEYNESKRLICRPLNLPDTVSIQSINWSIGGTPIPTKTSISPDYSMLEDLTSEEILDPNGEGKVQALYFHIGRKYHRNYRNNILDLEVITTDGQKQNFKKEIIFLKDGDQGTNGTSYFVEIFPSNVSGTESLKGYHPLINGDQETSYFSARTYRDGEQIFDGLTYEWSCGEGLILTNKTSKTVGVSINSSPAKPNQYYLKLKVNIPTSENKKILTIYKLMPVDIAMGFLKDEKEKISKYQLKLPDEVQYSSGGQNPRYDSSDFIYDSKIFTNFKSLDENLIKIKINEGKYSIKPTPEFIYEQGVMGAIQCLTGDPNKYIIHTIVMYLNIYGNESINGWDGTKLEFVGPKGEEHTILAPQIGAGTKDSANKFSGVIMGKDEQQGVTGIYGYKKGTNTFSLTENGDLRIKGYIEAEEGSPLSNTITEIQASNGEIKASVESLGGEVNTVTQTLKGVVYDNGKGTTVINGNNITTGTIDANNVTISNLNADNINLQGSITWGDLSESLQNQLVGDGTTIPDYIQSTYIDPVEIKSPTITGNNIQANNAFKVSNVGYMGPGSGISASGKSTSGVIVSSGDPDGNGFNSLPYLIVTNAGVRMQAGDKSIIVTNTGAYVATGNQTTSIGSGGGGEVTVKAVWGV